MSVFAYEIDWPFQGAKSAPLRFFKCSLERCLSQDDDDDEDYVDVDMSKEFFCDEIVAEGLPVGDGIPTE
eukprot:scaffold296794_cov17-Prasinocladus_malaysianus.AAC.1